MEALSLLTRLLPKEQQQEIGTLDKPNSVGTWFLVVLKFTTAGGGVGVVVSLVTAQFFLAPPCLLIVGISLISIYYVRKLRSLSTQQQMVQHINTVANKVSEYIKTLNGQIEKLSSQNQNFGKNIENFKETTGEGNKEIEEKLQKWDQLNNDLIAAQKKVEQYEKMIGKLNQNTALLGNVVDKYTQTQKETTSAVDLLSEKTKEIKKDVDRFDEEIDEMNEESEELSEGVERLKEEVNKVEQLFKKLDSYFIEFQKLQKKEDSEIEKLGEQQKQFLEMEKRYNENLELEKELNQQLQNKLVEVLEKKSKKSKKEKVERRRSLPHDSSMVIKINPLMEKGDKIDKKIESVNPPPNHQLSEQEVLDEINKKGAHISPGWEKEKIDNTIHTHTSQKKNKKDKKDKKEGHEHHGILDNIFHHKHKEEEVKIVMNPHNPKKEDPILEKPRKNHVHLLDPKKKEESETNREIVKNNSVFVPINTKKDKEVKKEKKDK